MTKEEFLRKVGKTIREAREELDYKREYVALHSGLDVNSIGGIERGMQAVNVYNFMKLCKVLNLKPSKVLSL